jgi:hypothetical protein
MWLYTRESFSPYAIGPTPVDVANWCRMRCIRRVYTGASPKGLLSSEFLAYFRALKCALGSTELFATFGLPEWADAGADHGHHQYRQAAEWASSALTLTGSSGERLFRGIMLNVEPKWRLSASQAQMKSWLIMHQQVLAEVRDSNSKMPESPPPAEAWFCLTWNLNRQTLDGSGPLDQQLLRNSDGCSFMTYRNTKDTLHAVAAACLASSNAVGRPVRLTVECADAGEGPGVDFSRKSQQEVLTIADTVIGQLAPANPHLRGIDFHHYEAWRALRPS